MSKVYVLREKDNTVKKPEWKVVSVEIYREIAEEWVERHGPRAKVHRDFDVFSLYIPDHILDEWNC